MDLFFVTSVRRRRRRARLGDAYDRPFRIFFYDGPFRFVDGTTSRSKKKSSVEICEAMANGGYFFAVTDVRPLRSRIFLVRIILRWSVAAARRHRVMYAFVE